MVIKKIFYTFLFGAMFVIAGCNTMQGVGEDVEKGGEAIHDAAS